MLTQVREQFLALWKHQSSAQRIVLITLVVGALILVPLFIAWANTPSFAVAYSGLSESDAGEVTAKLDELGIPYQLRGSSTILVPSNRVYDVRLKLAREGLPEGGEVGFELFSGNMLGMTEFTQRVNYQRALEGELERTISSLSSVQAVRVHIVTPEKTLLSEDQAPTTASITVQERPGANIDAGQVSAITHLVSSAVEGLKPENVVVVDINGNLLSSGSGESPSTAATDAHLAAERQASEEIQRKVQNLLDKALGPNRSVVQAGVTMDWTERTTSKQAYDPNQTTLRSSQLVTEAYTTTNGLLGGIPGAVTNLPPTITSTTASGNQGLAYLRSEKTMNYEITQIETVEVEAPGEIKNISLSVLVDGITDTAKLAALESTIAAAAGIVPDRGDVLAVEALAFDRSYYTEQAAALDNSQRWDLYIRIGQVVLGVIILAALLWYIQRLLTNLRLASSKAWVPVLKPVSDVALPTGPAYASPMQGYAPPMQPTIEPPAPPPPEQHVVLPEPKFEMPVLNEADEQMQRILTRLAEENPSSVAEIIQMWLNEDE